MAQKFVGIELGSYQVKVVEISAGLRGVQVLGVYDALVEPGGDPLESAMSTAIALLREHGLRREPVGVAVLGGMGGYRALKFPFSDAKRIAQTVAFEAEGKFPMPLDEMAYDHVSVSLGASRGGAFVAALPRSVVDHVSHACIAAGVELRLVSASPICIAQAAIGHMDLIKSPVHSDDRLRRATLLIDLGHRATELVFIGDKGIVAARSFRFGGKSIDRSLAKLLRLDSSEELARIKSERLMLPVDGISPPPEIDQASSHAAALALAPLVREIDHTRQWLQCEWGHEITEIRLAGGTSGLKHIELWLSEQTGFNVSRVALRDSLSLRRVASRDWSEGLAALGAAMGVAKRPIMQMYDNMVGKDGLGEWMKGRALALGYLGMFVLTAVAVEALAKVKGIERERDAYVATLRSLSLQELGHELDSSEEVKILMESAGEDDLASLVPMRGALDVFAEISRAAIPAESESKTPGDDEATDGGESGTGGLSPTSPVPPASTNMGGNAPGMDGSAAVGPATLPVVPPDAGIVKDDELYFSSVDIRERKIVLNVAAKRASAKDRLRRKLQVLPCMSTITPGKTRDSNNFKVFAVDIDHDCFRKTVGEEAE